MLRSWPPGTPPAMMTVFHPLRAAVSAAVRPARPPPMIATSTSLAISPTLHRAVTHASGNCARPRRGPTDNPSVNFVVPDRRRKPSAPLVDENGGIFLVE